MADKKSVRRFTIQFNRADPAHRQVADILNGLEWRGKAQYIVNAVLHYISRNEKPKSRHPVVLDEKHIEMVVNKILRDRSESGADMQSVSATVGRIENPKQTDADVIFDVVADTLGEDGLNAISNALNMFRKK